MLVMKTVEIITHCFAEKIPAFASLLTAQLSSLILWEPRNCMAVLTICYAEDDQRTKWVIERLVEIVDGCKEDEPELARAIDTGLVPCPHPRVDMKLLFELDRAKLFRRSIGRNMAARRSRADIVWFADCDYIFGEGCLDALAASEFTGLTYPQEVQIHRAHHIGDAEIARIKPGELFTPDLSLFETKREKFAIGGLQIVPGDVARKYGYCDGGRWQKPADPAQGFQDTREDKAYRQEMIEKCGPSKAIHLPNLYRFRHSESAFEDSAKRLAQTAGKV